ncbi:hypothetical protein LSH36_849g00011 [Paralvinella palmiformis]|uniref:receptor protein-tyrosine kinase n=1 Tax=Paralvinella palmiformis TaxID=53620 RepID=A0AAD9IYP5_9ANNE|nr:hypothetical protein LSH36_849g00011 [Paralvinella palmiformis]
MGWLVCNAGSVPGGNVSLSDDPEHSGTGGSSFISPQADSAIFEKGIQEGDGEVEIAYIFDCQCDFLCIYFNEETKRCYCPPNYLLAEDGKTCLNPEKVKKVPQNKMITITTASVLGVLAVSLLILLVVLYRNKCKFKLRRLKHLNNPDYQLSHLRNVNIPRSMEYNPNYDFGGAKCSLQDLREIPRQHLLLIRALGQGAFGEVYQGYLSNLPPEATDMPVAVKTLPALSTEQAEMDFLMEALIMSKFDHPNIVKFVGVCFEKHPRFIILELLEGGDLKNFLRECRPKEHPPQLPRKHTTDAAIIGAKRFSDTQPSNPGSHTRLSKPVATRQLRSPGASNQQPFGYEDIAARNCLLTTKGPSRIAKIADFGMARDIYRADYYRKGGKAMLPVKWMPPEAFMDGIFTSKTDVWSFGILLWEVFSLGYMPYPGRGNHEVMQLVTAGGRLDPPHNCLPSM